MAGDVGQLSPEGKRVDLRPSRSLLICNRMQKMQDRQRELQRLQLAEEPDYDAIKEKSREIGELQQQMAEERIEMHKHMREALDQN
jgi:Spy/CpxP family protein refolding chaperone